MYNNIKGVKRLRTANEILCGLPQEFTRKDYENARPKGKTTSFGVLVEKGIVKKVRFETFSKEVRVPIYKRDNEYSVVVNDNDEIIKNLTMYAYNHLPIIARQAIDKIYNEGRPLHEKWVKRGEYETIECKKYFYVFDQSAMNRYYSREVAYAERIINYKRQLANEATRNYNKWKKILEEA